MTIVRNSNLTDGTYQRYFLLRAFRELGGSGTAFEVSSKMKTLAVDVLGDENMAISPQPRDDLLAKWAEAGEIVKSTPDAWRITDVGREVLQYVEERVLDPNLAI